MISLGYKLWRGETAGIIGTTAIAVSFICAIDVLIHLQDRGEEHRQVVRWRGTTRAPPGSTRSSRS